MLSSSNANVSNNLSQQNDPDLNEIKHKRVTLSIKEILGPTFSLIWNQLGPIFLLGLFAGTLPLYLSIWMNNEANFEDSTSHLWFSLIYIVSVLIGLLCWEMGVLVTKERYDGVSISWKNAYSRSVKLYFRVGAAAILVAMAILGGFICFIIPGFILTMSLTCVIPEMLIENSSLRKSWSISFALTKGCRIKIFLLFLICGVISWIDLVIPFILAPLFFSESDIGYLSMIILAGIIAAFLWPLNSFCSAFIYCRLREKKGMDQNKPKEISQGEPTTTPF